MEKPNFIERKTLAFYDKHTRLVIGVAKFIEDLLIVSLLCILGLSLGLLIK